MTASSASTARMKILFLGIGLAGLFCLVFLGGSVWGAQRAKKELIFRQFRIRSEGVSKVFVHRLTARLIELQNEGVKLSAFDPDSGFIGTTPLSDKKARTENVSILRFRSGIETFSDPERRRIENVLKGASIADSAMALNIQIVGFKWLEPNVLEIYSVREFL